MIPESDSVSLILASSSPRRRQLLALTGWEAVVCPVEVEERSLSDESARTLARRLALDKARISAKNAVAQGIILAADTVVTDGGRLLGKPVDSTQAEQMLLSLRGREHRVVSAIALIDKGDHREVEDICETFVPMRNYSAKEITTYIASGDPMDKAGAYGIQNEGFRPVEMERLHGCFANVMGLPLCHLVRSMHRLGYYPQHNVPVACQAHTGYTCHVYSGIIKDLA
jgi:septum formation protein